MLYCFGEFSRLVPIIKKIEMNIEITLIHKSAKLWLIRYSINSVVLHYSAVLCSIRSLLSQSKSESTHVFNRND